MDDRWPAVDWSSVANANVQQAAAPKPEDVIDDGVAEIARKFAPVRQEAPDAPAV
jgi:hypothetical protein